MRVNKQQSEFIRLHCCHLSLFDLPHTLLSLTFLSFKILFTYLLLLLSHPPPLPITQFLPPTQ